MGECLRAVVLDNRRPANRRPLFYDRINPSDFSAYRSVENLGAFKKMLAFEMPDLAIVSGGDGTLGAVINSVRTIYEEPPVLYYRGGGSANTWLKDLVKQPKVDIPSHLQGIFREGEFEGRHIHALVRESEEKVEYGAYLVGAGHPTVPVTRTKEWLYDQGFRNTHLMYLMAGAASALTLLSRTQPTELLIKDGDATEVMDTERIAGAAVFTTNGIGTFVFQKQLLVPRDKVRLFTISADSEPGLIYKYNAALLVGLRNPDRAVEKGLIDVYDVDGVRVFPGQPENPNQPNCCIDGELVREDGPMMLYRDNQQITVILHIPLIERYRMQTG
ncbi:MAG: hypothetical protein HY431_00055 [Candidatus Levybacteria bacterium]|nr:hypothetical protein [Candidatus Levybacteria bacterium]